jgi:hypothetical protein
MHWKAAFRFLETKQVEPGELLYNSGAPALMFSGDTPGDDHFPGLLSGTEDPPIVFGADRIYFRFPYALRLAGRSAAQAVLSVGHGGCITPEC